MTRFTFLHKSISSSVKLCVYFENNGLNALYDNIGMNIKLKMLTSGGLLRVYQYEGLEIFA